MPGQEPQTPSPEASSPTPTDSPQVPLSPQPTPALLISTLPGETTPSISIVNAVAFMHASKLLGSKTFRLFLSETGTIKQSFPNDDSVDLTKEYHEFTDVFSKRKADTLVEHCSYDLKINLKEDAASPIGMIYSLSPLELEAL